MKTVRTIEGTHIVLAEVQAYRPEEDGTVEVTLRGGGRHSVSHEEWINRDDYEHVVAAQPGTYLLSRVIDQNGKVIDFHREPVVGWGLAWHGATPITVGGVDKQLRAILHPDGSVEEPGAGVFYDHLGQYVQDRLAEQDEECAPPTGSRH
jgi:hypothetical protein